MEQASSVTRPPHVLIFPLPIQGHVNSMLKLAELLALSGLQITFLNTEDTQQRLFQFTDIQFRFATSYPNFTFVAIPDGLPMDHPRADGSNLWEVFESLNLTARPIFKEMLMNKKSSGSGPPVNCIIGDGCLDFVFEAAVEVNIPIIHMRTISACSFWMYFCLPHVIEAGELPVKGEDDLDRVLTKVPGMETFLRCRDLHIGYRAQDLQSPPLQMLISVTRRSCQAQALILNTFEDLEAPILSHIRTHCPKLYTIGPLHEHLKSTLKNNAKTAQQSSGHLSSNGLWKVDTSCLEWLDGQPSKSVVYVSFGSLALVEREQLIEFWHGLVNSKQRFLWVRRPGLVADNSSSSKMGLEQNVPQELIEGTKERGKIVDWAPQEEVLAHRAIGGFLTHSGWNSTLESIVAGVPMICWPYFADQQINSRFVGEVWKIGLDMKDVCDRVVIAKMVNDLMVDRREEFVESTAKMGELARKSTMKGGTSSTNLDLLIKHIRSIGT